MRREICIFSSIVHLTMCLYGYVLRTFILHFGSEPCTIYFTAQMVPVLVAGSRSGVSCVWDPLCSLLRLPTFCHDRKPQVLWDVLRPESAIPLGSPGSSCWRIRLETEIGTPVGAGCCWGATASQPSRLTRPGKTRVCGLVCTHVSAGA